MRLIAALNPDMLNHVVRAFSAYFTLANIAEENFHSTIKLFILTRWVPVVYALHAAARYFNDGVGSSRPKSLPFMCLAESRQGKSRLVTARISSNRRCGSSASTIPRITSIRASIRDCCCRLPTVHAGRWFSMRARYFQSSKKTSTSHLKEYADATSAARPLRSLATRYRSSSSPGYFKATTHRFC